jgi:hypothetical protein
MSGRQFNVLLALVILESSSATLAAQVHGLPFVQNFDSVAPPLLPSGWSSTQNRTPGVNDFTTTSGTPRSLPSAVLSTNATIGQSLVSPLFDFSGQLPDKLIFYTRRSVTHLARMVVEASLDSGITYPLQIEDSLLNTGSTNYVVSSSPLPSVLTTSHSVRFRWRIIPDASGSSGTLRIDDVSITVLATNDLALSRIRFEPLRPVENDSVKVVSTVRNVGFQLAQSFGVDFFVDANNDSLPEPEEFVAGATSTTGLGVGDSLNLSVSLGRFPAGEKVIIGKIVFVPDQNPSNDVRAMGLTIGYRYGSVVVNEIMYAPTSTEPEWVELYNTRSDSINLKGWLVSDSNVLTKRTITSTTILIPPNGYVVMTKDSAALVDIHPAIPCRIIDVTGFPTLNNSGDAVVLYDDRVKSMDSVGYVPGWGGNTGGKSLERIDPSAPSTTQANWGTSRHGSTPGVRNSLTRKDHDLRVDSLVIAPDIPVVGDRLELHARIQNIGIQPASPFTVLFFEDLDGDSLAEPGEMIGVFAQSSPLAPLDSVDIVHAIQSPTAGVHPYISVVSFAADEDSTNNVRLMAGIVGYRAGTLLINEVMYSPAAGIPEWVELLNLAPDTVDLKDWKVGNRSFSPRYTISTRRVLIPPTGLLVITKDSALLRQAYSTPPQIVVQAPSLPTFLWNNNGDAVVFLDNRGVVMDSMFFSREWGGASGTSLERIDALAPSNDSTNWVSATDSLGATPGRPNSVLALDFDLRALRAPPVMVPPNTPAFLSVTIQNIGKHPSGQCAVLLYNDRNNDSVGTPEELITQISIAQQLARRESLVVTGQWTNPPAGRHNVIALVDYAEDQRLNNNKIVVPVKVGFLERSLVVNEIMYAPLTGNAEYVEVTNPGERDVDVSGWKITDRPASSGSVNQFVLSATARILHPGEFFVIASDSSLFTLWPELRAIDPRLITIVNQSSLSLNNDGDAVVLRDLLGTAVDSVSYMPSWNNPYVTDYTGRSLERINPLLNSNDARSWSTCAHVKGGTPGRANSIFATSLPVHSQLSFSPNPFSPDGDGREDFTLIQYELPLHTSLINIKIYDVKGRLIRRLANNEPSGSRGTIVWDGRDDGNQKARMGIYVVLLEAIDGGGANLETAKGVVVLAGRL